MEEVKKLNTQNSHRANLDVAQIFTNVAFGESINKVCDYNNEHNTHTGLPVRELDRLLRLCAHNG